MKNILFVLIGFTHFIVIAFPISTWAQDTCFLRGANGQSLNLSSLCGNSSPQKVAPKNFFQIPIKRRVGGIPTVEVLFNGKHMVEMLFDTGASVIVLNEEVAQAIGISKSKKTMTIHTAGGIIQSNIGRVISMAAGGLMIKNVEVSINPKLGLPGLLGQRFYADYDVTIKKNIIELRLRKASER